MPKNLKTRYSSVTLPDAMVKKIAADLGIKDLNRVPKTVTVHAVDVDTAIRGRVGVTFPGNAINFVLVR